MPRPLLLVASMILALSIAGCARTQPIYNISNESTTAVAAGVLTTGQVKDAILKAAREKGWIAREEREGHIAATIYVRHHMAEIDITYSPTRYSISYKNSDNLLSDGRVIHRNYNKWIKLLNVEIKKELAYD